MDELFGSSGFEKFQKSALGAWVSSHRIVVLIACVGLVFFGYGLMQYFSQPSSDPITIQSSSVSATAPKSIGKGIVVDIEGAVTKPGVYTLSSDARVQDGLIAAGGLSSDADRKGIARLFNMAAKLTDGGKLYFPFVGDPSTSSGQGISVGSSGQVAGASTSVINLNTANEAELDSLPGIGAVTAQKIISNRPYQTVDELTNKKVVSASVFSKIKDLVSTN